VARKIKSKPNIQPLKLENRFLISTPLGDIVFINHIYMSIRVTIERHDMVTNLMSLEMDWLSTYKAQMDCLTKIMTLQGIDERQMIFK
jgi:hypothetical protein